MKQYLGIFIIVLGALLLIVSYFADLVDLNIWNVGSLFLIILGIVTHILVNKLTWREFVSLIGTVILRIVKIIF